MQPIPKTSTALSSLLRADLVTQWRNRRSFILLLLVPVIILISWKGIVEKFGGPFAQWDIRTVLPAIAIKEYFKDYA